MRRFGSHNWGLWGCRAGNPGRSEMAEDKQMRGLRVSVVVWGGGVGMEPGWEVLHWHCWLCLNLYPPQRREHTGFLISCCEHKGKREGWSSETVSSQISKTSVWLLMLSFAKTMVTPLAWDAAQLSAFKMWLTCFLNFPPQCPIFHPAGHSSLCGLLPSSVPSTPFPASGPGPTPLLLLTHDLHGTCPADLTLETVVNWGRALPFQASQVVLEVKNLPANAGDEREVGQEGTWKRAWQPTPVFSLGEFHGQRNPGGYGPQCHKESETTEGTEHAFPLITESVIRRK